MKLMQKTSIMMSAGMLWVSLFYISTQNVPWLCEDVDGMIVTHYKKFSPLSIV